MDDGAVSHPVGAPPDPRLAALMAVLNIRERTATLWMTGDRVVRRKRKLTGARFCDRPASPAPASVTRRTPSRSG